MVIMAKNLSLLGLKEDGIANAFGISSTTLRAWGRRSPEFRRALHEGREIADGPVVAALYAACQPRMMKRERPVVVDGVLTIAQFEEETFDWRAAAHWLGNRHPGLWGNAARDGSPSADREEIIAQERAVRQLLAEVTGGGARTGGYGQTGANEVRGAIALLGLAKPALAGNQR
jgi:hypothetical protein